MTLQEFRKLRIRDFQNGAVTDDIEKVIEERDRLRVWVNDLQACLFVNCVYCGHRYGPLDKHIPQEVLTAHVESCPQHPLFAARQENERLRTALDRRHQALEAARAENETLRTKLANFDKASFFL